MRYPIDSELADYPGAINRLILSDQVKQYILDLIERGDLEPGGRLVASQFARQFKISQAPVREAIRELVSTGFLVRKPHHGTLVRKLTDDELTEIYTIRALLESLVAQQAVQNITDEHLEELRHIVGKMVEMAKVQDYISVARYDWHFHALTVDISGNRSLRRIYENLQLGQYILITMRRSSFSLEELARRHFKVIEALETRDARTVRQVMCQHVEELNPATAWSKAPVP